MSLGLGGPRQPPSKVPPCSGARASIAQASPVMAENFGASRSRGTSIQAAWGLSKIPRRRAGGGEEAPSPAPGWSPSTDAESWAVCLRSAWQLPPLRPHPRLCQAATEADLAAGASLLSPSTGLSPFATQPDPPRTHTLHLTRLKRTLAHTQEVVGTSTSDSRACPSPQEKPHAP